LVIRRSSLAFPQILQEVAKDQRRMTND